MARLNCDKNTATLNITALLRKWITELEDLEAKGEATFETCNMLVDLHQLLEKLDAMFLKRAGKTMQ